MSNRDDAAVVETKVRDDRTILTIEGWPEASVIVRSASGERIYLPPENPEPSGGEQRTSPYSTGSEEDDDDGPSTTPYSTAVEAADEEDEDESEADQSGRTQSSQGIRIIHPEPVTDVRVLE